MNSIKLNPKNMGTIKIHPMENLISIKLHPEKIHQDFSSTRIPPDSNPQTNWFHQGSSKKKMNPCKKTRKKLNHGNSVKHTTHHIPSYDIIWWAHPSYDGPSPSYDGPSPSYDGPSPSYDGPQPIIWWAHPSYDIIWCNMMDRFVTWFFGFCKKYLQPFFALSILDGNPKKNLDKVVPVQGLALSKGNG